MERGARPYLRKGSPAHQVALAVWNGEKASTACLRLGIKAKTGATYFYRLRQAAAAYEGRQVSDTYALRLLFDWEQVRADKENNSAQK